MADVTPLDVACIDCAAPPQEPCLRSDGSAEPHAARVDAARLTNTEPGTCALCNRPMRRGQRAADGPVVAWHPDPADAAACPRIPDPAKDGWNAYAEAVNRGLEPGLPGNQHFIPAADCAHEWPDNGVPNPVCLRCGQPVPEELLRTHPAAAPPPYADNMRPPT